MKNKAIKVGVITTIATWLILAIISILWFGKERLFHDEELFSTFKLFTPIWAVMFGFCGWWITKRYYQKKAIILGENYEKTENIEEWKRYQLFTFAPDVSSGRAAARSSVRRMLPSRSRPMSAI